MCSKVLIVDDELDLCRIIKFNLAENGIMADIAQSAEEALKSDLSQYSVILLDVMMEGISGHELLQIIREERKLNTPVMFVSAMGSDDDLEKGYQYGADDYIRKPFSVKEMILRVKALIERSKTGKLRVYPKTNEPQIDNTQKTVKIGNNEFEFTRTEYDIFKLLYQQPGKVYSRDEILERIWHEQQHILGRTVDVNITRIRKKMGPYGKCIVTRSGYGYYFDTRKLEAVI